MSRQDIVLETNTYDKLIQYPSLYFKGDNFKAYLDTICREYDEIKQCLYDLRMSRTITYATGVNLDNIGEIVGEDRQTLTTLDAGYFTFESNIYGDGFDVGKFWSIGADSDVIESRDDNLYRKAIKAKIIKNNGYASPEEIIELAKLITDSTDIIYEADYPAGIKIYYNGDLNDAEEQYAGQYIQSALGAGIKLTEIKRFAEFETSDDYQLETSDGYDLLSSNI